MFACTLNLTNVTGGQGWSWAHLALWISIIILVWVVHNAKKRTVGVRTLFALGTVAAGWLFVAIVVHGVKSLMYLDSYNIQSVLGGPIGAWVTGVIFLAIVAAAFVWVSTCDPWEGAPVIAALSFVGLIVVLGLVVVLVHGVSGLWATVFLTTT